MLKVTEVVYIAIAVISLMEIARTWGISDTRFYIFIGFAVVSAIMYFVRRGQRIHMENYYRQKEKQG